MTQVTISSEEYDELRRVKEEYTALVAYTSQKDNHAYITRCEFKGCKAFEVGDGARSPSEYYHCTEIEHCVSDWDIAMCDMHFEEHYRGCVDCSL